jgi:Excalibur calcium-binding domain
MGQTLRRALTIAFIGMAAALPPRAAPAGRGILEPGPDAGRERGRAVLMAQRQSCKAASTCREAVVMWCNGYSRADADHDGIPCENVCRSRSQVDAIKSEIDC